MDGGEARGMRKRRRERIEKGRREWIDKGSRERIEIKRKRQEGVEMTI